MYFTGEKHESNFSEMELKFPQVKKNAEYRSTCYIAAMPDIRKCFKLDKQVHGPFDWYFDYLDDKDDFIARRDRGETTGDTAPLTGGTRRLVELALNLWNGKEFDLSEGLATLDYPLYMAAMQAIDLRRRQPSIYFPEGPGEEE